MTEQISPRGLHALNESSARRVAAHGGAEDDDIVIISVRVAGGGTDDKGFDHDEIRKPQRKQNTDDALYRFADNAEEQTDKRRKIQGICKKLLSGEYKIQYEPHKCEDCGDDKAFLFHSESSSHDSYAVMSLSLSSIFSASISMSF